MIGTRPAASLEEVRDALHSADPPATVFVQLSNDALVCDSEAMPGNPRQMISLPIAIYLTVPIRRSCSEQNPEC